MSFLNASGFYISLSWFILPCKPASKVPHVRRGLLDASRSQCRIRSWSHRWPSANIGVACRRSGLLVIDEDPRNGGDRTLAILQRQLGPLPSTVESRTGGGGRQFFFQDPGLAAMRRVGNGVDIISNGYVVVPPSVHPSGNRYSWRAGHGPGEVEVLPLPEPWKEHIFRPEPVRRERPSRPAEPTYSNSKGSRYGVVALLQECSEIRTTPEGGRNHRLNTGAFALGQLVAGGELDIGYARAELLMAASAAGLSEGEASRTIASGIGAGLTNPRSAPTRPHGPTPSIGADSSPPQNDGSP